MRLNWNALATTMRAVGGTYAMLKMKALTLAVGCLLVGPVLASTQVVGSVEYLLDYARKYSAEGQTTSAESYAKEALALDPDNKEARAIIRKSQSLTSDAPTARPPAAATSTAAPSWDSGVGSAEYFLKYARDFMIAGNRNSAAAYAKDALKVDPSNTEARAIIRAANRDTAPAVVLENPTATVGTPGQIGSLGYLLGYARGQLKNGSYTGAADYAAQALRVDPSSTEAKQIMAIAKGRRDKAGGNSCQAQFSTCWAGAQTYTVGGGYRADNARRQQCFVARNLCEARAK